MDNEGRERREDPEHKFGIAAQAPWLPFRSGPRPRGSEWRSELKKDLTGPTLLEMSGYRVYQDLTRTFVLREGQLATRGQSQYSLSQETTDRLLAFDPVGRS